MFRAMLVNCAASLAVEEETKVRRAAQGQLAADRRLPGLGASRRQAGAAQETGFFQKTRFLPYSTGSLKPLPVRFRHENAVGAAQAAPGQAGEAILLGQRPLRYPLHCMERWDEVFTVNVLSVTIGWFPHRKGPARAL